MIFKADLHTHTCRSIDGRQTLEQLISAAKEKKLDAVAITEHDYYEPLLPCDEVLLVPACECSTDAGHITGLFLESAPRIAPRMSAEEAIGEIHRCGGIAVLAHPYQKASERSVPAGLDAIETANARAPYKNKGANILAYALAEEKKLPGIGGSDAHSAQEVGNAYTEIEASEKSLRALKQAILCGDCRGFCKKETPSVMIGLSQLTRRRRMGGIKNLCIGFLVLIKYFLKDIKER